MAKSNRRTLPVVPLAKGQVLLPGISLRISVQNRPDVAALLARIYSTTTTLSPAPSSITVACVPLKSAYLGALGEKVITDADEGRTEKGKAVLEDVHPAAARGGDLFGLGCVARVSGVQQSRGAGGAGGLSLIVEGVERCWVRGVGRERPFFEAVVEGIQEEDINPADINTQAQFASLKQLSREFLALIRLSSLLPRPPTMQLTPLLARRLELYIARKDIPDAGTLADFMANIIDCTHDDKLLILSALSIKERLERVIEVLQRQITTLQGNGRVGLKLDNQPPPEGSEMEKWISTLKNNTIGGLRNPNAPGGQNGGGPEDTEMDELKKRLEDARMTPEAAKIAAREMARLVKMNPAMAEHQVCRNYLEVLAEIPWSKTSEDRLDGSVLVRARKQLDDDHYGLEKIKKRLLEYLAVLKLKSQVNAGLEREIEGLVAATAGKGEGKEGEGRSAESKNLEMGDEEMKLRERKRMVDKAPILLLVGPPGTGKTSLAKSIATALGRKFHRISLGGVRDEAEIRGHRRTYVAAMPGLIVSGLRKVGVANPVFLLDELDKLSHANHQGDPSAAMLEVLDPEQNHTFMDHYVNIPIDLSKVLFIATANSLDTIPPPLLDRMETIGLSGYTTVEKRHIALRHLLPKQIMSNGLEVGGVELPSEVLDTIITGYTRESGVRNLEREIGSVCRFKAVEFSESKEAVPAASTEADSQALVSTKQYTPAVSVTDLEEILGQERFEEEIAERAGVRPGVVTGLVAYSSGGQGSILFIEILDMPGTGRVQLTGKLGDVLKESVEVALSWVKSHAFELGLTSAVEEDIMKSRAIHVHCPAGAVPKDGPSAGLAHTIALISLFSGRGVDPSIAMTGEVSLRGKVTPVGGIKEKLIGALRAGVKTVMIPYGNRKDVKELPVEVREGLKIVEVSHIWEGLRVVWPDVQWAGERGWSSGGFDSRL